MREVLKRFLNHLQTCGMDNELPLETVEKPIRSRKSAAGQDVLKVQE